MSYSGIQCHFFSITFPALLVMAETVQVLVQ